MYYIPSHATRDAAPVKEHRRPVASLDWSVGSRSDHSVQFYESEQFVISSLLHTITAAFNRGETFIVVATADHQHQLQDVAEGSGIDLAATKAIGQFVALDANQIVDQCLANGTLDWRLFVDTMGGALSAAAKRPAPIRVFSEMAPVLWRQNRHEQALKTERFWNDLAKSYRFTLHCACPLSMFNRQIDSDLFTAIASEHDRALPAESYVTHDISDPGLRHVSLLQQEATALRYEATERIKVEQALRVSLAEQQRLNEASAAKDDFMSIASHQLRTPATAVKQYLGILLEGYDGPLTAAQREKLQKAYDTNERQLKTLADLLLVARVDAGKVHLIIDSCDVTKMLQEVIADHIDEVVRRSQHILFQAPPRLIIKTDQRYLRMAVDNLIDNASKYSPDGKPIFVTAGVTEGRMFIAVRDEGIGISKKNQAKICQKFARVEDKQSAHITGTGLGLYWAKKIIELHGGELVVNSRLHHGSTFTIWLPEPDS